MIEARVRWHRSSWEVYNFSLRFPFWCFTTLYNWKGDSSLSLSLSSFFTIKREVIKLNSSMKIPFGGVCPLLRLRYLSSVLISNFVLLRVHFLIALLCFLFFSLSPARKFTFSSFEIRCCEVRFDLVTLHGVLCYRWPIFIPQSSRAMTTMGRKWNIIKQGRFLTCLGKWKLTDSARMPFSHYLIIIWYHSLSSHNYCFIQISTMPMCACGRAGKCGVGLCEC